jgi:hypothetical protein
LLGSAWGPAFFTCAIAIDDAPLCQVIWGEFHIHAVTGKNSNTVAAQASRDMSKDDVAIVELDGKGRARKNLLNAAQDFKRRFFDALSRLVFCRTRAGSAFSIARRNVAVLLFLTISKQPVI